MSKNIYNTAEAISSLNLGENIAVLLTLNTLVYIVMKGKEKNKKEKSYDNNIFCHKTVSLSHLLNTETSTEIPTFNTVYNTI